MPTHTHEILLAPREFEDLTVYSGQSLMSAEGTLWITTGDGEDIVLNPGEIRYFRRKVRILMSSLNNAPARARLAHDVAFTEAA